MPSNDEIVVVPCPAAGRAKALQLLLLDLPPAERVRQANRLAESVADRTDPFAGLFWACHNEVPVAASWAQIQPGRTGVLWRPHLNDELSMSAAIRLLNRTADHFAANSVTIAQALLTAGNDQAKQLMQAGGYNHLTDLEYFVCLLRPPAMPNAPSKLEYEVYSERNQARFCRLLEQTYQYSLDCPELDSVRDMDEVLTGYRNIGEFHPSRWMILRHDEQDVGCLILTDHAAQDQWELVYLGLVPDARGLGLGYEAANFAKSLAYGAHRSQLVLAVDCRNAAARNLYERAGFIEWDRRCVFWRRFSS